MLYNVPGRTGVNLEAETVLKLAMECENVVAVKEASGRLDQAKAILDRAPKGFELLSGDDGLTLELIRRGATGVISVVANAYPAEFGTMVHAALDGDFDKAEAANDVLAPLYPLLSVDGNPAGLKSLLDVQGKAGNYLRLPLVPASEATYAKIKAFADAMNA